MSAEHPAQGHFRECAAWALRDLLLDRPQLNPVTTANYGPWSRPLAAVARAYAAGGCGSAVHKFGQLQESEACGALVDTLLDVFRGKRARRSMSLRRLLAAPPTVRREVVPGLLRSGLTLLTAPTLGGKSWLALQTALAAAGAPTRRAPTRSRVLYLALEDAPACLARRLQALEAAPNLPLYFCLGWPALDDGGLEQLAAQINGSCRLVVVDTFTSALSLRTWDDPQRILGVIRRLHVLAAARNIAVLLVDRHRYPRAIEPLDAVDAAFAAADQAHLFERTMEIKRRFGRGGAVLHLSDCDQALVLPRHPDLDPAVRGAAR